MTSISYPDISLMTAAVCLWGNYLLYGRLSCCCWWWWLMQRERNNTHNVISGWDSEQGFHRWAMLTCMHAPCFSQVNECTCENVSEWMMTAILTTLRTDGRWKEADKCDSCTAETLFSRCVGYFHMGKSVCFPLSYRYGSMLSHPFKKYVFFFSIEQVRRSFRYK